MSAHTPGPWYAEEHEEEILIFAEKGRCHIATVTTENVDDLKYARADARLIAAAPALLKALEAMLKQHSVICEDTANDLVDEDCAKARAAIAKARG